MNIILGCDPLLMPLTGIGHYTYQIGKGLHTSNDVDHLDFYAHGRFFEPRELLERHECPPLAQNQPIMSGVFSSLRASVARSRLAVKAYQHVIPWLDRLQLGGKRDAIFHSPNFMLPSFRGRRIVTIHDLSTLRFPEYHPASRVMLVNDQIKKATRYADHIITDSVLVKQEIIDRFSVSPDCVSAIPLGAETRFCPYETSSTSSVLNALSLTHKEYFLFVSTVEPRKNVQRLLQAYKQYRQSVAAPLPLVMVGAQGWADQSFRSLIEDLVAKQWVVLAGYQSNQSLAYLMSSAKALLFPSIYEGFGLPALEAMQSGTLVVTSQGTSMQEICLDAAIYVDPLSVESIQHAILKASEDSREQSEAIQLGLEYAKSYSWEKCVEQTLNVYNTVA
ncbi:glycosyltransferase family 4 protein [Aestuariibacter halophilus]|uniref:Glycosyltransferase family 4 protein n=1 Tax=Fluctibacter halophilus TaxID=226011 RepID=A0ABS8G9Y9_9ALTE|nr:glycosyltransferase family 1 protein [Aestuariibacter halophilus]MCC2617223.1 glycosyltransferase family 4 protein [Aestuariibacter halophilus]